AVTALLTYEPARRAIGEAAPIMVEMITPLAEVKPLPPKPRPPEHVPAPKPMQQSLPPAPEPPSIVTEAPAAPSPLVAAAAPPVPPAPVQAVPAPPITPPVYDADSLNNPQPAYPKLSRNLREQGLVVLHVLVNAAGRAERVEVRTSSGFSRLDDSAVETVKNSWKFIPAKRGDETLSQWLNIPFNFIP
ncbi:MAG TPA: energy transducer TonB, partial [Burkholderiales bacterium]|nr:energy transducer TonB [Burkholderiales bacterium]